MTTRHVPSFDAFAGEDGKPTATECRLIDAASKGWMGGGFYDEDENDRNVSAALIVALATDTFTHDDWPGWKLTPAGLRLSVARIVGALTLENRDVPAQLWFSECEFSEGLELGGARINGQVRLENCIVYGSCRLRRARLAGGLYAFGLHLAVREDEPTLGWGLDATGLQADFLNVSAATIRGGMCVNEAVLTGSFDAEMTKFLESGGGSLFAAHLKASGISLQSAEFDNMLVLADADIAGTVQIGNATFSGRDGKAIGASGLNARALVLSRSSFKGTVDLENAAFTGDLTALETDFESDDIAISAAMMRARNVVLSGARVKGSVYLGNAGIEGGFIATGGRFEGHDDIAFSAQFAVFSSGFIMREATEVTGHLDLAGAEIGKLLDLSDSRFCAEHGPALRLQEAKIPGEANLTGSHFIGAVFAARTFFEKRLTLADSTFVSTAAARLRGLLAPDGAGEEDRDGAAVLDHYAIVLREARIDGRLVLPRTVPEGIIDLSHARCRVLEDHESGWPKPIEHRRRDKAERLYVESDGRTVDIQHFDLDGFQYDHLEYPDGNDTANDAHSNKYVARARGRWLAAQSGDDLVARFNPQPWRQASGVLRGMGYDGASQIISIERRVRERFARDMPRRQKFVSWLLHLVADYGFNPWKTVLISVAVVLASAALYWGGTAICGDPNGGGVSGRCGTQPLFLAVQHNSLDQALVADGAYPNFGPVTYSLDTFVPLFDFGTEVYWRANANAWMRLGDGAVALPVGHILYWLFVIERFLGAILIAIAVTGFTGLLTRDEK